jgi:hypothetical protein
MKVYVGIDPGKTGAVAVLHNPEDITFYETQEFLVSHQDRISSPIFSFIEVFVCIEKAQPFPDQGVVSVFSYGVEYGKMIGMLKVLDIPFAEIHPNLWKKEFSLFHQPKERSVEVAKQLFPSVVDKLTLKKHHNRAEALLIAEYARRKNM